jgi:hypothetical protein
LWPIVGTIQLRTAARSALWLPGRRRRSRSLSHFSDHAFTVSRVDAASSRAMAVCSLRSRALTSASVLPVTVLLARPPVLV